MAVISGTDLDDNLTGTDQVDTIYGLNGNDSLFGRSVDDSLFGGAGDDLLFGEGRADSLFGGDGQDANLIGSSGDDVLFGGQNRDRLNGASGSDTAYGGNNNDTFIVDGIGQGDDVLRSNAGDFTLGTAVEVVIERVNINATAGNATLVGNDNDDILAGNSFDNLLVSQSGSDRLNSRGGSNTMNGGSGDDTFVVTSSADQVQDVAGDGTDLVRAEVSYTLPNGTATAFVENLRLQGGMGDIDGAGNVLENTLRGRTGADLVTGGLGNDLLFGESGSGQFFFNGANIGNGGSGGPILRDFDGFLANAANGEGRGQNGLRHWSGDGKLRLYRPGGLLW